MKQGYRYFCAITVSLLVFGAFSFAAAQTTPDPFITQITSTPAGNAFNPFFSSAGGISGNGRLVVFESNGDVATERTDSRNNADGNREIFLLDYAQRRIFQITDTTSALKPPPSPTPTPTPSASPTPSPAPTPQDGSTVAVEVSNNRATISTNGRWITFSSNALNPFDFDGNANSAALAADGNQELWLYFIPAVPVENLSSGAEAAFVDLTTGTFTQITNTPASRLPVAGSVGVAPFVADDNRDAMMNDNASVIAFVSTRNLVGTGNTDGNPEIFIYRRSPAPTTITQLTSTADVFSGGRLVASIFNENPSLSASGTELAFISNANHLTDNNDSGTGFGNGEVFLATYNTTTAAAAITTQVTHTKRDASAATVNVLSPGQRLSRGGNLIAFESLAENPKGNSTTNKPFLAMFVYNVATDTFTQVGLRAEGSVPDIIHFPTFTDYDLSLQPATLVFASALNFKTDGTFPAASETSAGLNPTNQPQIFSTSPVPPSGASTFVRLTNNPVGGFAGIRPFTSNTRERMAFALGATELGGGNADGSSEIFYFLSRVGTDSATPALSFFTGASNVPVDAAPAPSPSPSPTPTPTPGVVAFGLAAGELSIVRATAPLAPSAQDAVGGSETARKPILPIELNGVSVAVNGSAAGLYSVRTGSINFVMPIGLPQGIATVVVNNNGTTFRGFVRIVSSQPDIFTDTNDAGGNAVVCNVTNPSVPDCITSTFPRMSLNDTGALVPTVIEIWATGLRGIAASETKVTIGNGTTNIDITPSSVRSNTSMFGFDLITLTLPSTVATGDNTIVVTVTKNGTFQSRAPATAPHINIGP